MTRISTSELYNNRNIIKQICDLQDEIGETKISNVAFSRAAEQVTLTITMEDASTKTASFADRSVTNVTASQTGAVVTLTFTMSDGTTYPVTFTASGSGGATITAGQGITVTGDPLTGYVVAVDNSYVATKSSVNDLTQRVLQAEAQVAVIDGVVRGMTSQINANTQGIAANVTEINLLNGRLGSETLPGTILGRIKSLEEAEVTIDTANYSALPGHVPGSVLVNNTKMNEPENVGSQGQILVNKGTRRSEWVTPATGLAMDSSMSDTSENPVKNKVIKGYVDAADTILTDAIEVLEDEVGAVGQAGTIRDDIHTLGLNKQDYNNLVIAWETTPSHSKYPSEKLVYDSFYKETVTTKTSSLSPSVLFDSMTIIERGPLVEVKVGNLTANGIYIQELVASDLPPAKYFVTRIPISSNDNIKIEMSSVGGNMSITTFGAIASPITFTFVYMRRD